MILQGRNLIIKANGVPIAAAKSCTVSIKRDRFEVSSPVNGVYKEYLFGRKSWSVQTNHLVTSIVKAAQIAGTTISLEFGLKGLGLPFDAFVNGVSVTVGTYSGTPGAIAWDKTRKQFLAVIYGSGSTQYYQSWTNDDAYAEPSDFDFFTCNGVTYSWVNEELTAEKLTGNADVLQWECTGGVGHLATGAFEFGGNGGLYAAALP